MKPKLSAEYVAGFQDGHRVGESSAKLQAMGKLIAAEKQIDGEGFGDDVKRGVSLLFMRVLKEFKK